MNQALKENRAGQTLRVLALPELQLQGLVPSCGAEYQRELSAAVSARTLRGARRSSLHISTPTFVFQFFH